MTESLFYSLACYTYIVTGVVCAIVKWCHVCRGYEDKRDYYFPAWRQLSLLLAVVLVQLPYVLRPTDSDTWFFARTFGILYYPMVFSVLICHYFYEGTLKKWLAVVYSGIVMTILLSMLFTALLFNSEDVMDREHQLINLITGGVSLVLSSRYVWVSCRLVRLIELYQEQNYSNVSDFPFPFARKVAFKPLIWVVVAWTVFISESRMLKAFTDIYFAASTVVLLCGMLHTHRTKQGIEVDAVVNSVANEESLETEGEGAIAAEDVEESVRRMVLDIIERRYTEPNLKRVEVIACVPYRKKKQAGAFITSVGFYRLVNMFRLYHLEEYSRQHPEMSSEGAAMMCGFKDRFALNNARKRITEIDMSLVERNVC